MSNLWGATSTDDIWGLTSDNANLHVTEASQSPDAQENSDASDEYGDICATVAYGNTSGTIKTASVTYQLVGGELDLSDLILGEIATGKCITSISVNTSNSDCPTLTVEGKLGYGAMLAPTGYTNQFTLPAITIKGNKVAQPIGFTFTSGATFKLTASSFSASVNIVEYTDGEGEKVGAGVSAERATASGDFVKITADPSVTWAAGWVETQKPTTTKPKADWNTSTVEGTMILTRDAAGA